MGAKPDEGSLIGDRFELTDAFRAEVVRMALADVRAEIDLPTLLRQAERATMFAG